MNPRTARRLMWLAILAALLQVVGLARYIDRLPNDWVGIGLYLVTILALALAAFGFYVQGRSG